MGEPGDRRGRGHINESISVSIALQTVEPFYYMGHPRIFLSRDTMQGSSYIMNCTKLPLKHLGGGGPLLLFFQQIHDAEFSTYRASPPLHQTMFLHF